MESGSERRYDYETKRWYTLYWTESSDGTYYADVVYE
jgi:hypothetical protein